MASIRKISGGVTAAKGFLAAGASAGMKRSKRPDISLVVADQLSPAACVFTLNKVKAAPVQISQERIRAGHARAVFLNSAGANCLTGKPGYRDALQISKAVAQSLQIDESGLLVASTGIIGQRLPVEKIKARLPKLVGSLSRKGHQDAAAGILTTDTVTKEYAAEVLIGGTKVRIGGMAKGSGMIAPSMATMLAVVTTDAAIAPKFLNRLLVEVTNETFNQISVDGDMSTNDTVFMLASGAAGKRIDPGSSALAPFKAALKQVFEKLAYAIVLDGEGATRTMEVLVEGAKNAAQAQHCARQVALSPLVKTMLTGGDPNVGRIAGAVGASLIDFDPDKLTVYIGKTKVIANGTASEVRSAVGKKLLSPKHIQVRIVLHAGKGSGRMVTCDLTKEYVHINTAYPT